MEIDNATLQQQFAELRSKSLREAKKSEQALRRTYKALLKDVQHFLSEEYAQLAEDGTISYAVLQRKGQYARFLKECTERLDGFTPDIITEIEHLVHSTYELNYKGMVQAVSSAKDLPSLAKELKGVKATIPETVKRAVNNPIDKLTLKETLEHKRAEITYNIRKQVGIGLVNGDRYETMAKRISDTLDSDYKKAITIVRTEAHRVQEQGLNDAAIDCSTAIRNGKSGLISVKTWKTGRDKRVRDSHSSMEGVTVLVEEEFELPSGAVTMTPGDSGVASEDICCRCYCSYKLVTEEEYFKLTGKHISDKQQTEDKK